MNETIKTILSRRSCRNFMGRQLEDEILNPILEAGTWAASGMGKQSARMVVIQDATRRSRAGMATPSTVRPPLCWFWPIPRYIPGWRMAAWSSAI